MQPHTIVAASLPISEITARLSTIPGVGDELARRISGHLAVDTLEALECAAVDGRLAQVPGVGARRVESIRQWLDTALSHRSARGRQAPAPWPPVAAILAIDRTYRQLAEAKRLPQIAPRRLNPRHQAWLPVWRVDRDGWSYTAMYSNTARAHQLGKTRDWVIVLFGRDEGQSEATVVTEFRGELAGLRVVRGRELDCRRHHRAAGVAASVQSWAHDMAARAG